MKKEVMVLLLLGILLILPLVSAQEQSQIYSGFDRFIDNVKMVFSFGDKKVMLALEIREKEINSAIINTNNGENEEAEENLERARTRLQYVQDKVSIDTAEDVKLSVDEILEDITAEEDLPDNFEVYVLEERKTQLTAELVIKVEGSEGQTEIRTVEGQLGQINNEIKEWVVENTVEGEEGDEGLTWEIKKDIVSGDYGGDDGLTPEIKTYVAGDGTDMVDEDFVDKSKQGGIIDTDTTVGDAPGRDDASPDDLIDDVTGEPITHDIGIPTNDISDSDNTVDDEDVTPEPNVVDDGVDSGSGDPGVVDED